MSLKKKIILSFIISALLVALLVAFEYVNYVQIRSEIRFLELTDTVRSKSLQLRRHEKNFFLYSPVKFIEESLEVHRYLDELDDVLNQSRHVSKPEVLRSLQNLVNDYRSGFDAVEALLSELTRDLKRFERLHPGQAQFFPLIEATFYERPFQAAEFLETVFRLPGNHPLPGGLRALTGEISRLRKNGEEIINVSKELDRSAREKVETGIRMSQLAILIVVPLFLLTGIAMLFLIARNIVKRIALLRDVVERTTTGSFAHVDAPERQWGRDEVGVLIRKFDEMEVQLAERAAEISRKNDELMRSKKLAAIGTLAAGVAHELNNPLNNIYLSTQVLARELGTSAPDSVREVTADIIGQTERVKKIVGDLLAFARGREPKKRPFELNSLIMGCYARVRAGMPAVDVRFTLDSDPDGVQLAADPEQLEQVFINLFGNALDAVGTTGTLSVTVTSRDGAVSVQVADNGPGIPREAIEQIFEPFYTTKDKGTGLGLAIVYNIVRKHGGDIMVESEAGNGTTFTITLPKQ